MKISEKIFGKKPSRRYLCFMSNYNKKKEPAGNRKNLLDAALEIVSEVGLESLTLDAVAKKANLSKGGLLHHFPKKDALIHQMFTDCLDDFLKAIREEQKDGESAASAYLRVAVKENLDDKAKNSSRILLHATMLDPYYREEQRKWYKEYIVPDTEVSTPEELAIVMVADGLFYSNLFGVLNLSNQKKQQVGDLFLK